MNPPSPGANPYHPIQTQPGSSRYPILSPVQNTQYPLDPLSSQRYSQQNPYNSQNIAQNGATGYTAPGNYGNRQARQAHDVNSESFLNAARMRELDQDLDGCFIRFYKIWLWMIVIGSAMSSTKYLFTYLSRNSPSSYSDVIVALVIYGFWCLIQSVFGHQAIYKKSLAKANVACWMMTIYLIPSLIIEALVINWIGNYNPGPKDDDQLLWYGVMYFVLTVVTCHILAHVFVDMNGAFRVRKILAEKRILQEKLNESGEELLRV